MSTIKKILLCFAFLLIFLNAAILISGKTYLYKGIANTYLKGRSGPDINEYGIFSNREIKTGTPQEWLIAGDYNSKSIPDSLEKEINKYETVAYLIIKDDSIRHEEYWEGFTQDTLSNSFSMAKTIISILVGAAITEGKIKSVDQPAGDFLPEFSTGENGRLTIKHLLTMSSGIEFDEDYASPFAYPAAAYYGTELRKLTMGYKVTSEPGKTFKYLSGNTQLLAFIVESATGMKTSDYASEKLWKPMGANNKALWNLDHENGVEKAYCCFISNARDFARFGKLYLNHGKWKDKQLIDSNYVAQSLASANLVDINGKKNEKYGYAWWLLNYKNYEIFYARGILGQYIICIPNKKMIIVRLGHKRASKSGDNHPKDLFVYIDAALEMYSD